MARIETDVMLGQRYRLVRRIASGGMGTVWEAEDAVLHRPVAVKVLSDAFSSDSEFVERFRREARAAAGLAHPDVARVFDYGEDDGTQFIVMELVAGETLAARLSRGPIDPDEAVRITQRVAEALQAAHDAGVVHRDVKPGNIMLTPSGRVKVMDFGIAAAAWDAPITVTGTTLGTAFYISPEQAAGKKATPASDVYSLGIVLYEMLTGRPPFTGQIPVAVAAAHLNAPIPNVRGASPSVPEHVALACEHALSKDPAKRPSSAGAFAAMLRSADIDTAELLAPSDPAPLPAVAPAPVTAPEPEQGPDTVRQRPSSRWEWAIPAALIAVALMALLIGAIVGGGEAGDPTAAASPTGPKASPEAPTTVKVPNVEGMRLADAQRALRAARLNYQVNSVVGRPAGVVFDTDPDVGTRIPIRGTVTLSVGAAPTTDPGGGGAGGEGGGDKPDKGGRDKGKGGGEGNGRGGKGGD